MKQHKLGQHYTNKKIYDNHKTIVLNNKDKIIVDPYVGEGNLIMFFLDSLTNEEAIKKINNKEIYGFDIDLNNLEIIKNKIFEKYNIEKNILDEIFFYNDSLLNNPLIDIESENIFLITNPPYLAKNHVKKLYKDDFEKYFLNNNYIDYFEIALNLFKEYNGLWIVPSNFLISEFFKNARKKILEKKEFKEIYIYEEQMFDNTKVLTTSFVLLDKKEEQTIFKINNNNKLYEYKIENYSIKTSFEELIEKTKPFKIKTGFLKKDYIDGKEKILVMDSTDNNKIKEMFIDKKQKDYIEQNQLIFRALDTGTKKGEIALLNIKEQFHVDLFETKISSRAYVQFFLPNFITLEEQNKIMNIFNQIINIEREKNNSIFLTNFKNASNGKSRKRMEFKQAYKLITYIYNEFILKNKNFD